MQFLSLANEDAGRVRLSRHFLFALLAWIFPVSASAEPFVPANDAQVLEHLVVAQEAPQLRTLRRQHEEDPKNPRLARQLIDAYIRLGKDESDPRYWGLAEAVLKPHIAPDAPERNDPSWLLPYANILQHRHEFTQALHILKKVLSAAPGNAEAQLMRAVIYIARAEYGDARAACKSAAGGAGLLISLACTAQVDSLTGSLAESYAQLEKYYAQFEDNASTEEKSWALAGLGDMAVRRGDAAAAERWYKEALQVNARDYFVLGAYADLLLEQKRYGEIKTLLDDYTRLDHLLLRLALAEKGADNPRAMALGALIETRYGEAKQRGELLHLRDYARYFLDLANDPAQAYMLALANWQTQKEPADALILLRASIASGRADTARMIAQWQRGEKREDAGFDRIAGAL